MARSEKALAAVEKLFKKNPKASTEEFLEAAQKADPSLKPKSLRSFHSGYVLPFKRKASSKKRTAKPRRKKRGRPRKTTRKKAKARKKKARTRRKKTRTIRKKRPGRPPLSSEEAVRRMVLKRDRELLAAASDPHKTYELAASVDQFVRSIVARLGS